MKVFNQIEIRNIFKNDIKEIFDNYYDDIGKEVNVITFNMQETTYPCCYVEIINPISAERYADEDTFNFIDFTLNCEIYSKSIKNNNIDDSTIILSQYLIDGMLKKYPTFIITRNEKAPFRDDVSRRVISFRCTYDNNKNRIYSI